MTTVTVYVRLHAHGQPKTVGSFRVAGLDYKYGSKTENVPLAAMAHAIIVDLDHFYAASGAASERECVEQLRQLSRLLALNADAYEKALNEAGVAP